MKSILTCLAVVIGLTGCTVADVATARKLTVEDGAAFVDENHKDRQDIRARKRFVRDAVVQMYTDAATVCKAGGDMACAEKNYAMADDVLNSAYPPLATIALLQEWLENAKGIKVSANELKALFAEPE